MTADRQRVEGPKGRRRREDILQSAETLFATRGYEATTTQDIADSIGILKGSLYYYVSSKQELLFQVVLRNHQRLHHYVLDDPGYDTLAPPAAVHLFIERHVRFVLTHNAVSALYSQELDVVRMVDAWWEAISAERRRHEAALVRLITLARPSDESVVGDETLSAHALLSMANATIRWFHADGRYRPEDVAAHHAALAVRALNPAVALPLPRSAVR